MLTVTKWKGSYTVEAAIIVPLIMFVILISVRYGVDLHETVKLQSQDYEKVKEMDTMEQIRKIRIGERLLDK